MTDTTRKITLDDLNAYVDDALDAVRRAEVEAYLSRHPDAAEQVLAYRRQNEGMRILFGPARDGSTSARSSSSIEVNSGSTDESRHRPCSLA